MLKFVSRISVVVAAGLLVAGCGVTDELTESLADAIDPQVKQEAASSELVRVIDGDTIVLKPTDDLPATNDDPDNPEFVVRLIGVDAPEMSVGEGEPECGAIEATEFVESLIPVGSVVTVSGDSETASFDRYGRALAYVQTSSSFDVSQDLVSKGLAVPYYPASANEPVRYEGYVESAEFAASHDAGNYGLCDGFGEEFRN